VTTDFGGSGTSEYAFETAIQSDGKIVAVGSSNGDIALARYLPNGALDTSFGSVGKRTTNLGTATDLGSAVAIQADGRIVVAGQTGNDMAVLRYTADGNLDSDFGTNGVVTIDFAGEFDVAYDVAVRPGGGIVVAGRATVAGNLDFAVVQLGPIISAKRSSCPKGNWWRPG
jgi:uncharacterized delta-60 repeat protein